MRMWNVPTKYFCRQHLLGEHVELHMMIGTLKRGKVSIKGHVDKGQCDLSKLEIRHRQLVEEMELRGYNHKSPMMWDIDFIIHDAIEKYGIVEIDVENNLKVLAGRCELCKELQIKYGYLDGDSICAVLVK